MALRYVGHSEINASTQVSHASGVTLKRYLCEIVHCSLRFNFPWGKRTALRCIRLSKRIKQRTVNEFLTQGNETHLLLLLAFKGSDIVYCMLLTETTAHFSYSCITMMVMGWDCRRRSSRSL